MSNEMLKEQENKKENKVAFGKFMIIMVISACFGGVVGFLGGGADIESWTPMLAKFFTNGLGMTAPYVLGVLFLVAILYVSISFKNCKKKWEAEKDTNDEVYDEVDEKLNNILAVIQCYTIISYFEFSAAFYYAIHVKGSIGFLVALVIFIADIILVLGYQKKVVDFTKIMNPEKHGSVYDVKFQEKWLDSCDEAEKQMIGQCAYKAYMVTANTCVVLWVVFTMLAIFLKISLWPVAVTMIIWLVLTVSYLIECKKLSKKLK